MPPTEPPPLYRVRDVIIEMTNFAEPHAENIARRMIKDGLVAACGECEGSGSIMVDSMTMVGVPGGEMPDRCEKCNGTGEAQPLGYTCPRCDGHGGDPACTGVEIEGPHKNHGYWYEGHLEPGSLCPCDMCGGTGYVPLDQAIVIEYSESRHALAWGMYAQEQTSFDDIDKNVFARLWMLHPPDWAQPASTEEQRKRARNQR